jgi:phosphoesterase RecJ-like protein
MMSDLAPILDAIKESSRVVVVSHTNPDADAYGSSCGLAWALKALGKQVVVHNETGFIPRYNVIPGASAVTKGEWEPLPAHGLLIVVDCGALERVGDSLTELAKSAHCMINIDHHTSNSSFGHLNYVVEGASSTSELIFNLLKALEHSVGRSDLITPETAACLLSGIIGDTGSFRYSSTKPSTFLAAYELMNRGARPDLLTQELFANHSLAAVKLQSDAMGAIQVHNGGQFAEVVVTQEMLKKHGADLLDSESLAERARDIEGVKVSALYKQDVDLWRVSLRSRGGIVDVSAIATAFGGGGHKPAAAFRWRKDFTVLQQELREAISKALQAA